VEAGVQNYSWEIKPAYFVVSKERESVLAESPYKSALVESFKLDNFLEREVHL
jgi:hypothetical protein